MSENKIILTEDMLELLDDSEKNSEFIAIQSKTFLKDTWDRFKKNKLAWFDFLSGYGIGSYLCSNDFTIWI